MTNERTPLRGWVEFPQYTRLSIPMFMVRDQLAKHGLHVVTAADKAVLDAMAKANDDDLKLGDEDGPGFAVEACRAELARREALRGQ